MDYTYRIVRSDRRTMAIQITSDGDIVVRVPKHTSDKAVSDFVERNKAWLDANYRERPPVQLLTEAEMDALKEAARKVYPSRVEQWAKRMGVCYSGVTVRIQRSKWGSCSSKKHINLNALLMLAPPSVLDYVMVHELAHCLELNHSRRFWDIVKRYDPSYKESERWLKEVGTELSRRIPK